VFANQNSSPGARALPLRAQARRRRIDPAPADPARQRGVIGIIANPVSARDIRRVVAHAGNLQIADRVNILLRVLGAAAACGVTRALMMPDRGGISALLERTLRREQASTPGADRTRYPELHWLDMAPTSTVEDTFTAARLLHAAGASAVVVLGGDGTHRAVVRACPELPIAGLSTGTNNAFPEMREPTVTGLAVGLFASGRLTARDALTPNKLIDVTIEAQGRTQRDVAIVDAVITSDRFVGARALWKPEALLSAYLVFADPQCIGMSALGGLLQPVGRAEPGGLAVHMAHAAADARLLLNAPIAPGLVRAVPIAGWHPMAADEPQVVAHQAGTVALDGERELGFDTGCRVTMTLRENAFFTVDVARCMHLAAQRGLLHLPAR